MPNILMDAMFAFYTQIYLFLRYPQLFEINKQSFKNPNIMAIPGPPNSLITNI